MRARNIKPGFFKNEELVKLPEAVRLLFIGLWCMADRRGRMEDRPAKIKMEIYPCDQHDVSTMLDQLQHHAFILRYEAKGNRYIQIVNFEKHQYPHIRESESTIPAPYKHRERRVPARLNPDVLNPDVLNPDVLNPVRPTGQPYTLPDPKTEPKKCLVLSYKSRKGVPYDNREWDVANFSRCMKAAGVLLGICGDLAVAQTCLDAMTTEYDEKGLTWTLETVARNAAEWMKNTGRLDANASRAGLRLAIARRKSERDGQERMGAAPSGTAPPAVRDGPDHKTGNEKDGIGRGDGIHANNVD